MNITFIGDIHGAFGYYENLIKNLDRSVQVGDFGLGFPPYEYPKVTGDHWFIRGNHDDPAVARTLPNYLGDFGFKKEWDMFFVGGAHSIDAHSRIEGVSWWRDEEMTYNVLNNEVLPLYEASKPRIMVTHTCPMSIKTELLTARGAGDWGSPSVTERALQVMFEIHQPEIWLFGHFHRMFDTRRDGTRFLCLNTYQIIDVEVKEKTNE